MRVFILGANIFYNHEYFVVSPYFFFPAIIADVVFTGFAMWLAARETRKVGL